MKTAVYLFVFAASVGFSGQAVTQESTTSAPNVTVAAVSSQEVGDKGRYVGRVQAVSTVNIEARVEGYLEKRTFREGGLVKKGDLLYVIEKDLYEADVAKAKAGLEGDEANQKKAKVDLGRQQKLLAKGDVSQSNVDAAVALARAGMAAVETSKANLDTANINLGFTEIHSPIDGRISKTNVNVGNLIDSNTGTLATVTSIDPIYVSFYVGEKDLIEDREKGLIGNNGAALKVNLTLANGSAYSSTGSVDYIGTSVQEGSDTIELRATFDNPESLLLPNQFVNVTLVEAGPQKVLAIPQRAIQLDNKGHFVFLLGASNKIQRRDIRVGRQIGGFWQVSAGLTKGEKVVVQGIQKVRPGMIVNPTEKPE